MTSLAAPSEIEKLKATETEIDGNIACVRDTIRDLHARADVLRGDGQTVAAGLVREKAQTLEKSADYAAAQRGLAEIRRRLVVLGPPPLRHRHARAGVRAGRSARRDRARRPAVSGGGATHTRGVSDLGQDQLRQVVIEYLRLENEDLRMLLSPARRENRRKEFGMPTTPAGRAALVRKYCDSAMDTMAWCHAQWRYYAEGDLQAPLGDRDKLVGQFRAHLAAKTMKRAAVAGGKR